MKKTLLFLFSSSLVVIALISGSKHIKVNEPYTKIINSNWSIVLPNSYKEIYSIDGGSSFHGDGERYHIFKYTKEDDIKLSVNWESDKNLGIETEIEKVLNTLNVSRENMPGFQSNYTYYTKVKNDSSRIYLIFVTDTKKLYIIEDIS